MTSGRSAAVAQATEKPRSQRKAACLLIFLMVKPKIQPSTDDAGVTQMLPNPSSFFYVGFFRLKCSVEKISDHFHNLGSGWFHLASIGTHAVRGVFNANEFRRHANRLQFVEEELALMKIYARVLFSIQRQRWRRI